MPPDNITPTNLSTAIFIPYPTILDSDKESTDTLVQEHSDDHTRTKSEERVIDEANKDANIIEISTKLENVAVNTTNTQLEDNHKEHYDTSSYHSRLPLSRTSPDQSPDDIALDVAKPQHQEPEFSTVYAVSKTSEISGNFYLFNNT